MKSSIIKNDFYFYTKLLRTFFLMTLTLAIVTLPCCDSNNRVPPIPAKIKQFQNKAREVRNKQSALQNEIVAKKSTEAVRPFVPHLVHETLPIFELYVRTSGSPWVRYKDILADDHLIQDKTLQIRRGGIEAEIARESVDSWVALKIYGTGYSCFHTVVNIKYYQ